MPREVCTQSTIKRNDYHRYNNYSQDRVAGQNSEIERPDQSYPGKPRRAMLIMIGNVGDKKANGNRERRQLTGAVGRNASSADEEITGAQKQGAAGIQNCIEVR